MQPAPEMIDQVDSQLRDWVGGLVDKSVEVSFGPPNNAGAGSGVSVYLVELVSAPPLRGELRTPVQLALRYLVSTWGEKPDDQHRLLGQLALAAMTNPDFEVELRPLPAEAWAAFPAVPRPSFYLKLPLRLARPEPESKPVRQPLVVKGTHLMSVLGRVVGPGDVPVAGARVDMPTADLSTETDHSGRFALAGVPSDPPKKVIRVRARRREMLVEVQPTLGGDPLLIRFDGLED
jgi:hypothetical protein